MAEANNDAAIGAELCMEKLVREEKALRARLTEAQAALQSERERSAALAAALRMANEELISRLARKPVLDMVASTLQSHGGALAKHDREKDAEIAELQRLLSIEREALGRIRLALLNDPHGNAEKARHIADQSREEWEQEQAAKDAEIARLREQVAALESAIERDRTTIANGVNRLKRTLESRHWLTEGRGSYEWDDDKYRKEFTNAGRALLAALKPLEHLAADLTNSPRTTAAVVEARASVEARLAKARNKGAAEALEGILDLRTLVDESGIEWTATQAIREEAAKLREAHDA